MGDERDPRTDRSTDGPKQPTQPGEGHPRPAPGGVGNDTPPSHPPASTPPKPVPPSSGTH